MTQKEYDDRMNLLRRQETEEKEPINAELQRLTQQRCYLGQQIVLLNGQVGGSETEDCRAYRPAETDRRQVL